MTSPDKRIEWPKDWRCQTCHKRVHTLTYSAKRDLCHCDLCSTVSVMSLEDVARHLKAIDARVAELKVVTDGQ